MDRFFLSENVVPCFAGPGQGPRLQCWQGVVAFAGRPWPLVDLLAMGTGSWWLPPAIRDKLVAVRGSRRHWMALRLTSWPGSGAGQW